MSQQTMERGLNVRIIKQNIFFVCLQQIKLLFNIYDITHDR